MNELNEQKVVPQSTVLERISALIHRESKTRFSGGSLGHLWAFITPIFWISLVTFTFELIGRQSPIFVDPMLFVATGYLPYAMMRQTITSQSRTLIANRYLKYITPTSISEISLASALLELFNSFFTSVIIFGGILFLFGAPAPFDLTKVILGMFLAWGVGASFGTLVGVIGSASDTFARVVPIVLRPLFWISGVFYTSNEIPTGMVDLLSYNPLFHAIEITREGFFFDYYAKISDYLYPLMCILIFLILTNIIGNMIEKNKLFRHRI